MIHLVTVLTSLSAAALVVAVPSPAAAPEPMPVHKPEMFIIGADDAANGTLAARWDGCNYQQRYITGGQVNYSPGSNAFSVDWNTQQDFVVGLGWQPGSKQSITYSGSFDVTSGVGSLDIYGWSEDPLVEYYVHESLHGIGTGGWTNMGSLTSDGGTYDIYKHTQYNQPSIKGTSTFDQYISVRQSPRTSGTVTIANHIDAWAAKGMHLGNLNYQVVSVESWSGSGNAKMSISH